uniref:DUF4283 domain-containing protein n=1 Tax=Tanacetum cinerariifolium TaxID=118510 RepID=A0A699HV26_TANCI|nr:hypothetical protein [Tanacetum cinerariifolium]
MDKGFLNRYLTGSKELNNGLLEKGLLLGNIAAKVKSIDGKILGWDSPQAVPKSTVHDDGNRPAQGRDDARVNVPNSLSNENVISSAVCLPMEAIDEIKARFVNTLYGFPVGKRLAFPMVENYVKYAWAKYGLKRVTMHHGFLMFQFDSSSGIEKVKVTHIPLWVKMHNVPIGRSDYARALMEVSVVEN